MKEDIFYTLHPEFEIANDWIYFSVVEKESSEQMMEKMNINIVNVFSDNKTVSESEIDERIKSQLEITKNAYSDGCFGKEEYEKFLKQDQDRELTRQKIIEYGKEIEIEEGIASMEYLAALLAKPTSSFKLALEQYEYIRKEDENKSFIKKFEKDRKKFDKNSLITLILDALKAIEFIKGKDAKIIGLQKEEYDEWKKSVLELENNLIILQKSN